MLGASRYGTTLFEEIQAQAGATATVTYLQGTDTDGNWVTEQDLLVDQASQADVIIVAVGEEAYSEVRGETHNSICALGPPSAVARP